MAILPPIPAPVRRTKTPKKKALLIGIRYMDSKTLELLDLPHSDVLQLRQFLIGIVYGLSGSCTDFRYIPDSYGYSKQDITILIDAPGETQPTAKNIVKHALVSHEIPISCIMLQRKEAYNLVAGAAVGDHFLFFCVFRVRCELDSF